MYVLTEIREEERNRIGGVPDERRRFPAAILARRGSGAKVAVEEHEGERVAQEGEMKDEVEGEGYAAGRRRWWRRWRGVTWSNFNPDIILLWIGNEIIIL